MAAAHEDTLSECIIPTNQKSIELTFLFLHFQFVNGFILHMEPYQGKNSVSISQSKQAEMFPTTQRAVINVIMNSDLSNSNDGWRILTMDNRYTSLHLFVCLYFIHHIASIGTRRANCQGMNPDLFNMQKKEKQGTTRCYYDKVSKLLCTQWNDNKIVTVLSNHFLLLYV